MGFSDGGAEVEVVAVAEEAEFESTVVEMSGSFMVLNKDIFTARCWDRVSSAQMGIPGSRTTRGKRWSRLGARDCR